MFQALRKKLIRTSAEKEDGEKDTTSQQAMTLSATEEEAPVHKSEESEESMSATSVETLPSDEFKTRVESLIEYASTGNKFADEALRKIGSRVTGENREIFLELVNPRSPTSKEDAEETASQSSRGKKQKKRPASPASHADSEEAPSKKQRSSPVDESDEKSSQQIEPIQAEQDPDAEMQASDQDGEDERKSEAGDQEEEEEKEERKSTNNQDEEDMIALPAADKKSDKENKSPKKKSKSTTAADEKKGRVGPWKPEWNKPKYVSNDSDSESDFDESDFSSDDGSSDEEEGESEEVAIERDVAELEHYIHDPINVKATVLNTRSKNKNLMVLPGLEAPTMSQLISRADDPSATKGPRLYSQLSVVGKLRTDIKDTELLQWKKTLGIGSLGSAARNSVRAIYMSTYHHLISKALVMEKGLKGASSKNLSNQSVNEAIRLFSNAQ